MKVQELLHMWEETARVELTAQSYQVRLPREAAAKLQALADMYPLRSVEQLITELLSAALEDVESGLPYVRGENIVAVDEQGDPLYEDVGPTPRYLSLTQQHLKNSSVSEKDTH